MTSSKDRPMQALQRIAELWRAGSDRTVWAQKSDRETAGFDWWPGDFRVRVRAHNPREQSADPEFKLVIRTDFLKNVEISSERFEQMTAVTSRYSSSTYAWVYPPHSFWQKFEPSKSQPTLWFSSTGYISDENIGWLPDLLAKASILQAINAQIQSRFMPEMLGSGSPDTTRPDALRDSGLDEMLEVAAQVYVPLGEQTSRWAHAGEFEQFVEKWGKSDFCFGFGDATGMTLETPFGTDSALIRLLTDDKHPQLGHGLLTTLQLPHSADKLAIAREAAELNLLESLSWTRFPQLGCWHSNQNRSQQEGLAFTLFMPNALYQPGLVSQIAFWFMQRARWAREQTFPDMTDMTMLEILNKRFGSLGKEPS